MGTGRQLQVPGMLAALAGCSDLSWSAGQGWPGLCLGALGSGPDRLPGGWAVPSPYPPLPARPGSWRRTRSERQTTCTHNSTAPRAPSPARAGATHPPDAGPWVGLRQLRPTHAVVFGPGFSQCPRASSAGSGHVPCPLAAPQGLLGQASSGGRAGHADDRRVRDGGALSAAGGPPHRPPWADWEPPSPVSAQPHLTRPGPGRLHGPQDALSPESSRSAWAQGPCLSLTAPRAGQA